MNMKIFATMLGTTFIAELGGKMQFATLLFAARDDSSELALLAAASSALISATAINVAVVSFMTTYLDSRVTSYIAGTVFIGVWILTL